MRARAGEGKGARAAAGGAPSRTTAPSVAAAIDNPAIAEIFDDIAALLELEDANPFRVRAYRNAARTLHGYGPDLPGLLRAGQALPKLPGIGVDLSAKIREIVDTGDCALHRRLRQEVPASLVALLSVAGLGPKRVRHLYHDLGIQTPQQLYEAARDGRIAGLHGFGAKTQDKLLRSVESRLESHRRFLLAQAEPVAARLAAALGQVPGVQAVTVAGSFRRRRDTVGDLDILVAAASCAEVMQRFVGMPELSAVLAQGPTRASAVLRSGVQVDLRVIAPEAYGAALVYFTGSKAHNIAIRLRARSRGLKISEYGVFRGGARVAGDTEESVYAALGLPPIPPELREDRGEIEAAERQRLPHLVGRADLRGDLHAHTDTGEGADALETMAQAAQAAGLEYLAITECSQRLHTARGGAAAALLRQGERIDALNRDLHGLRLLKGVEVDILEDGSLDLPDAVLARLDIVIGAVNGHFGLSRRAQTQRLLRALAHPCLNILAHPAARLIGEREGIEMDLPAVIDAARRHGCALELNARPQCMDLDEIACRQARDAGVPVSIASDARRRADFANLDYGIGQARRGWLEAADVLNTRRLPALERFLRK